MRNPKTIFQSFGKIRNSSNTQRFFSKNGYFVTTPIFYVNGAPHIGHLQSCLYADAFSRIHRLMGIPVTFSTGTDEHGLKIQQAAKIAKKRPLGLATEMSDKFKDLFQKVDVSYTDFIRTTETRHRIAVQQIWNKLQENGYIYKGNYEGWYDVANETFVPASQIKEIKDKNGVKMVCSETGNVLEKMKEENYIFELSKFGNRLLEWIAKDVIKPKTFSDLVRKWIEAGLQDISISREKSRLPWGIPVPGDESQTIYVWLDALVNYLTVGGYPNENYCWPPNCHVIGKDILKFHAVYWPAFLFAVGLEPPSQIFCHSHWIADNEKMSKSKGNVVDPYQLIQQYGTDGLRYFLLRAAVPTNDSNYSETKILRLLNSELADTFGNLLSRSCAPLVNKKQIFPKFNHEGFQLIKDDKVEELIDNALKLPDKVPQLYLEGDFYHGIEVIMDCLRSTNRFLQLKKPWELTNSQHKTTHDQLDAILYICLEVLRISGLLLMPIIPRISTDLLNKLNVNENERHWKNLQCFKPYLNEFERGIHQEKSIASDNYVLFARRKSNL